MQERPAQTALSANDLEFLAYNGEYNVSDNGTIQAQSHCGTAELTKLKQ